MELKKEARMPAALVAALTAQRTELLIPWWTAELAEPSQEWTRADRIDTIAVLAARVIEQQLAIKIYEDKILATVRILEKLDDSMSQVNADIERLSRSARTQRKGLDRDEGDDDE